MAARQRIAEGAGARAALPAIAIRLLAAAACCCAGPRGADAAAIPAQLGRTLDPAWALPFAGLLLSIAIVPLLAPRLWHKHYGKIAFAWAVAFLAPFAGGYGWLAALEAVLHAILGEYLPFLALLGALYVVAGGVRLTGTLRGTPVVNTILLAGGTLAASVIGTTGAAMLLVRPLVRANRRRRHKRHVFVFLIILVANMGGALSPLGDPPLFLGFLHGVPFFWPTRHLAATTAFVCAILLVLFFALDSWHHRKAPHPDPPPLAEVEKLGVEGKRNLALMAAILAVVLMSGAWEPGLALTVPGARLPLPQVAAIVLLAAISLLSLYLTPRRIRDENEFTWAAMVEVAILFAAIFVTIFPVLEILRAGEAGRAAALFPLLDPGGRPDDRAYFWATGLFSAVLDNAPTYLLFFNAAGGDAAHLAGPLAATLRAISAGAVFFGALTYLGNAPNLMIRSIAEHAGIKMPTFFAYIAWAAALLLPVFAAVTVLFL